MRVGRPDPPSRPRIQSLCLFPSEPVSCLLSRVAFLLTPRMDWPQSP